MARTMTTPRDDLISKIQKLSQLTIAAGATEAEAALAAAKIAELMLAHNINESELSVRREATQCAFGEYSEFGSRGRDWMYCARTIGQVMDCKAYCSSGNDGLFDTISVKFFGFPADVAAAVALLGVVAGAMDFECEKFMKGPGKGQGTSGAHSFRLGMANRLNDRIRQLKVIPPGSALIVLKRDLVNAEWEKQGIRLGRGSSTTIKNSAAYSAGKSAGDRVDLGSKKVGQTMMIGRR